MTVTSKGNRILRDYLGKRVPLVRVICLTFATFVVAFIGTLIHSMAHAISREELQNSEIQLVHAIGAAMYSYADAHAGKYPTGKSSTEVFQQLIDGGYVTDPTIFYFPMTGKSKADGRILKPENISWDITDAVQMDDPDSIPLVFLTGYQVDYVAGGKAHRLVNGDPNGLAVFYKNNAAMFISEVTGAQDNPNQMIGFPFDPKGKTYRQLTPDGPLH